MNLPWAHFLSVLEESQEQESVLQFECKGAFLKFRSKLVHVERPAALSAETMSRFGVVPHHVTLTFANGVRVNLYMRYVESIDRHGEGVEISFKGEGKSKYNITFYPQQQSEGFAG